MDKRGKLKQDDVLWTGVMSCFLMKSHDFSTDWGQYEQNELVFAISTHRFSKPERIHKSKLVVFVSDSTESDTTCFVSV